MKTTLLLFLGMMSLLAQAGENNTADATYKPLKASYTIYSGSLDEQDRPTKTDRKLAIEVTGPAAKEIFDSLFPDAKVKCSDTQGERLRSKRNVWCIYQPRDDYRCFLGFNLRTGESIPAASC